MNHYNNLIFEQRIGGELPFTETGVLGSHCHPKISLLLSSCIINLGQTQKGSTPRHVYSLPILHTHFQQNNKSETDLIKVQYAQRYRKDQFL